MAEMAEALSPSVAQKRRRTPVERLWIDILLIVVTAGWAFLYMMWRKNDRLVRPANTDDQEPIASGRPGNLLLVVGGAVAALAAAALQQPSTIWGSVVVSLISLGLLTGALTLLGESTALALDRLGRTPRIDHRFVVLTFGAAGLFVSAGQAMDAAWLRVVAIGTLVAMFGVMAVFHQDMDEAYHPDDHAWPRERLFSAGADEQVPEPEPA